MLTLRNLLLVKGESTYGVDPVPTASDAVSVLDLNISVNGEKLESHPVGGTLSPQAHVIGQKFVDISFSVNVRGSGTQGVSPETSSLLKACGMTETIGGASVTYEPTSDNFASCTVYAYMDGIIHKVTGCRGSFEIVCQAGEFAKLSFTMSGLYQTPVDGALITGVYDTTVAPVVYSTGFQVGGYAARTSSLQVSLNNKVAAIKDINSTGRIEITGRNPAGSFDPEAVTEATKSFWADWEQANSQGMNMVIGSNVGNILTIDIPKATYDSVAWKDREGLRIYDVPFSCVATSGDDELKLVFS